MQKVKNKTTDQSESLSGLKRGAGMTFIESVIAMVIGMLILGSVYFVFFRYVSSSVRGEDTITSVRDAMIIFEDMRSEVLASSDVREPPPVTLEAGQAINFSAPVATEVIILGSNGTIRYSVQKNSRNETFFEKAFMEDGEVKKSKNFSTDRIREFSARWIMQKQAPGQARFRTKSLFVTIELQGSIQGNSGTPLKVNSVLTPPFNTKESSTWP